MGIINNTLQYSQLENNHNKNTFNKNYFDHTRITPETKDLDMILAFSNKLNWLLIEFVYSVNVF